MEFTATYWIDKEEEQCGVANNDISEINYQNFHFDKVTFKKIN